jgi:S1-C subfamily serine protease
VHGDPPDDFDAHPLGLPDDDLPDDDLPHDGAPDEDGPLRGWVPPDDRLWLHPSERATAGAASRAVAPPARVPNGRWVAGGMAACVAFTLVVVVLVLTTADTTRDASAPSVTWESGVPTTEAGHSQLTDLRRFASLATPAHDSTVALLVRRTSGTSVATGVVAEAGGIIVALRPVVEGARSITVVEPDGTRAAAAPVGSDPTTGITVLRIEDDLPAADFADHDPATGSMVVAMSMERRASGHAVPTTRLYAGTVLYAGIGQDDGFCATGVAAPMSTGDIGSPLVDGSGAVVGVLDAVIGSGSRRTSVFLPAGLIRDVVAQIVSHGSVDHGTLGVELTDAPAMSGVDGAQVESVASYGAAADAGLRAGDVVIGVDGQEIRSVSELSTRIYGDPPGAEVRFTVRRDGYTMYTTVVLDPG